MLSRLLVLSRAPVRFLVVVFAVSAFTIFPTSAQELKPIADFKAIAGKWKGTLTGPRGTGPYELTIKEDGSWTANGFRLNFKGSATVANAKPDFCQTRRKEPEPGPSPNATGRSTYWCSVMINAHGENSIWTNNRPW